MTVTLPERTLALLAAIDHDRARAIVRATDTAAAPTRRASGGVEIVPIGQDAALVIVGACPVLYRIPWIRPVAIAPGRNLISVEPGTSVDSLEIALVDLLDDQKTSADERVVLEQLLTLIRSRRRDRTITKGEILFVPPERSRRRR